MENFDSALNSDNNKEVEVDNDDVNAAVEFSGLNEVTATETQTETKTEVVADERVENSVMAIEEEVAGIIDEPAMADKIGVDVGLKEGPTDVAEGTEITDMAEGLGEVKEENENEAEVEEQKMETVEESVLAEGDGGLPVEMCVIAEETEAAEMDEMKIAGVMEEEETNAANAADEMQVIEEAAEMEEGDNAEGIEEGHVVERYDAEGTEERYGIEGDKAKDTEGVHEIEGDNAEDIEGDKGKETEIHETEGDNAEEIEEGDTGMETDVPETEGDNAEEIEEGDKSKETEVHETEGDNAKEIEEGDEIEEDNAEKIEGHEVGEDNVEETEEVHEIEEDSAEEIEEGDNAEEADDTEEAEGHEIDGDNAEETEGHEIEEDNAEEIEEVDNAEDTGIADEAEEAASDKVDEVSGNLAGKRKRGKNAKAPMRAPSRKKAEEDVCFICFDGGELVLCDRRGCPKAYHPTCVNRDDAFFRARGRWNCGWHICSNCEKNAYYMCYTCTFSLCKGCAKDAVILCVRGNKGFCESCMKTVMLIERNEQGNKETVQVDFDDKSSFEYLFKDYWVDLKGKLSLTLDELSQAKNPWKGSDVSSGKRESKDVLFDIQNDGGSGSDDSPGNHEVNSSKRRRAKKRLKSHSKDRVSKIRKKLNGTKEASTDDSSEWASKELLEFVMHMRNGDRSVCSQFDVQALLLEYIKRNKLRDPRRKSQIICDSRLEKLFGKSRVGHFEMLKLLESHFLLKEDSPADDLQDNVVDTEANQSEADGSDGLMKGKDRKRKSRRKNDGRGLQSNLDDYAAIDTNNINLIYLRRSLVENLIDNTETFHDKVVGAFVRIRISGSAQTQKQDLYRLVQVVGTSKAAEPYKVGKRTTEFLLEILNLNKTEIVSIDIISNQDFTEDECKRLRQSIKCGLINRLTVGDIQEKAIALQAVRVEDSLEAEITRFSHLCDRASDMGKRKELRECVEKLQLLKSPGERKRRLEEIPEVHADPNMDPSYESEDDEDEMDDKKQENSLRSGGSSFNRRGRDPISPGRGSLSSIDTWSGTRSYSSSNREFSRSLSNKGFSSIREGDKETQESQSRERPKSVSNLDNRSVHSSESIPPTVKQEIAVGLSSKVAVPSNTTQIDESEKIWHYKDPAGKIQGPFSMAQLRKWSSTGYFPVDLRIWRATEKQDESILLTDALAGNFHREAQLVRSRFEIADSTTPAPLEISKHSTDKWGSETNLPSPTPTQTTRSGPKLRESRWSPTPAQSLDSHLATTPLAAGNGEIRQAALVMPQSGHQLAHSPHVLSQSTESPRVQANSSSASVNLAVDLKNLQNLVHSMGVTNPQLLGSVSSQKIVPNNSIGGSSQSSAYGGWGGVPSSIHNPASSFIAGNPTGAITGQPSVQPSAPWGMTVTDNQMNTPRPAPENQNSSWAPVPGNANMGWGGPVPTNQGWVASSHQRPGPAPGIPNPGWTGHGQGWAGPAQGQTPANAYPGWAPPVQGPGPVANQGWVAPGQGPPQGNINPNQPATKGNMGGERFSGRRDGGDSGGGKPWNRQQSHSRGDSSRPPYKGQRVCKYHESGHCRKGAACDYMHT